MTIFCFYRLFVNRLLGCAIVLALTACGGAAVNNDGGNISSPAALSASSSVAASITSSIASSSAKSSTSSKSSSSISSKSSSSTASSTPPITISWLPPTQRADGSTLPPTEIGGYQIRYGALTDSAYTYKTISSVNTLTAVFNGLPANYIFEIATFDINGLYSDYVVITPKG